MCSVLGAGFGVGSASGASVTLGTLSCCFNSAAILSTSRCSISALEIFLVVSATGVEGTGSVGGTAGAGGVDAGGVDGTATGDTGVAGGTGATDRSGPTAAWVAGVRDKA